MNDSPIRLAIVGFGYWGPNIARNANERPEFELAGLCEIDPHRAAEFRRRYPRLSVVHDYDALLEDRSIDAVAIATPPRTHHELAKKALEAGKHALVEKPLATSALDARELIRLSRSVDRLLMPGHTFLYSPAVNKVRELIRSGEVGEVYFITSSRMNLGLYQSDGVVSDLAPHDLSILLYWLERPVTHVVAAGHTAFRGAGVAETAFMTLTFAGGVTSNVQISWLAPRKLRQTVIVGSKRMIQYDDTSSDEPVRVYDRGIDFSQLEAPSSFGEYQLTYRTGDVVVPRIEAVEPLSLELADFARAIRTGAEPRSNKQLGLEVVRVLEAAHHSMNLGAQPVQLTRFAARSFGHVAEPIKPRARPMPERVS